MFGFKHTMNNLEHNTNDHKVIRTRLYSRLLQVNGPVHLQALYPHLLAQLEHSLTGELFKKGMFTIQSKRQAILGNPGL
jgi:hypothetical protein